LLNVICLKHGNKYGADYVNKLYNMIQRHLTVPHRFVCFTDNSNGINLPIEIHMLPLNNVISGWWWKPYVFKSGHFPEGDINLFIDLDMVIIKNIDDIVNYLPGEFVGLRDVSRALNRGYDKLGSALMRWISGTYTDIWTGIEINSDQIKRFPGDQDWIWYQHKRTVKFFPDPWIISYKWEARDRSELVRQNNRWVFPTVRNVKLNPDTRILAFHGTPDPHEVMDPVIVDNWR
jgi:hypothetical protein